jgi:protein Mpv17
MSVQRALQLLKAPLRSYNEVAQKYPFETGVITTVVKTSAADLFAQKVGGTAAGRERLCWPAADVCELVCGAGD